MRRDGQVDMEQKTAVDERELDHAPEFDPEDFEPPPLRLPDRKRVAWVLAILLVIFCTAVLPPLISVNRFRGQIANSISASIGRPVHIDAVTLDMLPWPGFTLENFVVSEDPGFGTEPVIYARTVRARLRLRSLWRRPVEFSQITLEDPSVNLVHSADGRWNVESILLQAAKIEAAPTAQSAAGRSPRFPYISASGARINVKMGLEKMPISLTDADLALWLPEPRQWRLRLEGHPTRTDAAAMDTGTLNIEGTLGKASSLQDVPVEMTAEWKAAPLGAVSWVLAGQDAGLRGDMNLRTNIAGTMGENKLDSRLEITHLRRASFVPAEMLDVDLECKAGAGRLFHELNDVRCGAPTGAYTPEIAVTGKMPEVLEPASATGTFTLKKLPAAELLEVLRLVTPRVSPELKVGGNVGGTAAIADAGLTGSMMVPDAQMKDDDGLFVDGPAVFELAPGELTMHPVGLKLGAPAPASLDAKLTRAGLTMHLSGAMMGSRLLQMAAALPLFGDGLDEVLPVAAADGKAAVETPIKVDVVSTRAWFGPQSWTAVAAPRENVKKRRRR